MVHFEVVEVVFPHPWGFRREVFYFIEIVLSVLRNVLIHVGFSCLGPAEVSGRSRRRLPLILMYDGLRKCFSWIFIHFPGQWSCIFLYFIFIGCRYAFLDLEDVIDIV